MVVGELLSLVGAVVLGGLSPLDVVAILSAFPAYILLMAEVSASSAPSDPRSSSGL